MSAHALAPAGILIVLINIRSHRDLCAICSSCMWYSHSDHYNIIMFAWAAGLVSLYNTLAAGIQLMHFTELFARDRPTEQTMGGMRHAPTLINMYGHANGW
jgi:hypothetical protein